MFSINNLLRRVLLCSLLAVVVQTSVKAQDSQSPWWFGVSGATNLNFYYGTTQRLNNSLIVPAAFHKGLGVREFGSLLMEYRPNRKFGAILNVGYDARGAKFRNVISACNCPATLIADAKYITVEPSFRIGFITSDFYFFAGPRVGFNTKKDFSYTQLKQPNTEAEFSAFRSTVFSGQIGFGYDHLISSPASTSKISISPFLSFHPVLGEDPRTIESWSIATIRTGVAFKFGKGPAITDKAAR